MHLNRKIDKILRCGLFRIYDFKGDILFNLKNLI